jgi:hypothetical protein
MPNSFEHLIKQTMRMEPDIILIGEVKVSYKKYNEIQQCLMNNDIISLKHIIDKETVNGVIDSEVMENVIVQLIHHKRSDILISLFDDYPSMIEATKATLSHNWLIDATLDQYFDSLKEKEIIETSMEHILNKEGKKEHKI